MTEHDVAIIEHALTTPVHHRSPLSARASASGALRGDCITAHRSALSNP
jgi:hypothetical protein